MHNVYWTVENGTDKYTNLPTLKVTVDGTKGVVNVPAKISCSFGGSSVPMLITSNVIPFNDVKVSLEAVIGTDEAKTSSSVGLTPKAGESVTLKLGSTKGYLGFGCGAEKTTTGTKLKYKLEGTDLKQFAVDNAEVAVTKAKPTAKPANPAMKLAKTDKSTPALTKMEGECPLAGNSWVQFAPKGTATILGKVGDVTAALKKADPKSKDAHE